MSKIKKLDKVSMTAMRDPINEALAEIGAKLGLELRLGNGSYSPNGEEAHFKLEVRVDDPETKLAAEKATFERHCRYIGIDWNDSENTGLRPEDFGTEFPYAGATYQVVGLYMKGKGSQKFPIKAAIVEDPSNRCKPGDLRMLPETAVLTIRAATDAAKGKAAKAKAA